MTENAKQAVLSHLAVLRDSFLSAFPNDSDFVNFLPIFCTNFVNGKTGVSIKTAQSPSIFSKILSSITASLKKEDFSGIKDAQLFLECAIYERIAANTKLFPKANSVALAKKILQEAQFFNDDFKNRIDSTLFYVRTLSSLKIESFDRNALGFGFGDSAIGCFSKTNAQNIEHYAIIFRADKKLQRFVAKIGHHSETPSIHKLPPKNARPAVSRDGICFSNKIVDALPSELALKNDKRTKIEFLRRIGDGQLLCYKRAPDKSASCGKRIESGPIIVCLDTSGSMHGRAETISKATLLALVSECSKRNRRILVISFSVEYQIFEVNDPKNPKTLDDLSQFLKMSFLGGTDISNALEYAISSLSGFLKNADILLISDFVSSDISAPVQSLLRKAKSSGTRLFAVAIGKNSCPILSRCDEILRYEKELRTC